MLLGLVMMVGFLWLLGWRLAAVRPELLDEVSRAGQAQLVLPPPPAPRHEQAVPQLVCSGSGSLLSVRPSPGWQAPDGTRLSLN